MATKRRILILSIFLIISSGNLFSQSFSDNEYKKALWMTTRMYGGQRSGDGPNWLIMNHTPSSTDQSFLESNKGAKLDSIKPGKCFTNDADGTYSLSGGWVDCGDHVKFGQTMFYAAYMLMIGYTEFPEGYDDYYSWNYTGYDAAGDFSWEGGKGEPNGIPDILDELKYQTDFFIKCARNSTTFYSQVGMGDPDHKNWITSVAMAALPKTEGGQNNGARDIRKNPDDCVMPAMCAATLAAMSRVYEKFDPVYAATCLTHAQYAYDYAVSRKGNTEAATGGSFYPANSDWEDDYAIMLAEMYYATGNTAYKTEALTFDTQIRNHNWTICYNNCDDLAAYHLANLGSTTAAALLNEIVTMYQANANGFVYETGPSWGVLRYTAAQAFVTGLNDKLKGTSGLNNYVDGTIGYIMGSNSSNLSFIVGFGANHADRPHHRNYYLCDDIMANKDNTPVPTKNEQFGFLVGGAKTPSSYHDVTTDYESTEGGIDYNAGLVSALGYINAMVAPIDPNKFGHPTPELGEEKTLCGVGSVTLTATVDDWSNLEAGEEVKYKWYKNDVLFDEGNALTEVTVSIAGEYKVEVVERATEAWTTSDKVIVSDVLPEVSLGDDVELCDPAMVTLDAVVTGNGIAYEWQKNGVVIDGETTSTLNVYSQGTYSLTVSATGCSSKQDEITVGSILPEVIHGTICSAGTVDLEIVSPGSYEWYDVPEGGTALSSNATYSPSISSSKIFYVQDANSFSGTVGPATVVGAGTNWGISATNHLNFSVASDFTILSLKVSYGTIYNNISNGTISIEILDGSGNPFSPAKIFTSDEMNITTAMSGSLVQFTFTDFNISKDWGTDLRMRVSDQSINGALEFNISGASYPYESTPAGVVSITGRTGGGDATGYMYFYDWEIMAGSSCARTPVLATIDPNGDCNTDTDGDGTPDNSDGCPLDPNKIAPGDCGCGVVDVDTDGDGTADCNDACPNDPNKTIEGSCGCGIAETDSDSDGTFDCDDLCPLDPDKIAPGNCGCGVAESSCGTQTINFTTGWNLISFYIEPADKLIESVFAPISSQLQVIKDQNGFYNTSLPSYLNSITEINFGISYLVKVNSDCTLSIFGNVVSSTSVQLKPGWNMIGYTKDVSENTETVLSDIWYDSFEVIKNFDDYKTTTDGTLNIIVPGGGYFIQVNNTVIIDL